MKRTRTVAGLALVAILCLAAFQIFKQDPALDLRRAAYDGDVGTVTALLNAHPGIVDKTRPGDPMNTPGNSTFEHVWVSLKYQMSNPFRRLDRDGYSALEIAIVRGHRGVAQALLEGGADAARIGSLRSTAMHQAVMRRDAEWIELFAKHKANLNALDGVGLPALAWLTSSRDLKTAELMLELGADPNTANGAALFRAILRKDLTMTKLLVEHGADVNIADRTQRTPVKAAKDIHADEILAFLRSKGGRDSDVAGTP